MYQLKVFFGRLDEGVSGPVSFTGGEGAENTEDEIQILADQDETSHGSPSADDQAMGGMGTTDAFGLDSEAFAKGEIDLKEQFERTTRAMDRATQRTHLVDDPEPSAPPDEDGRIDTEQVLSDSLHNREPEVERPMHRGHPTGAYTDIGAGRSGVTRD